VARRLSLLSPHEGRALSDVGWHSAQHARQIIVVLERLGVTVDRPLGEKDYAGLPLPVGVWE